MHDYPVQNDEDGVDYPVSLRSLCWDLLTQDPILVDSPLFVSMDLALAYEGLMFGISTEKLPEKSTVQA
ncbi:hypothetical protein GCM10023116_38250 [Kistimonas scapharcae]|uniref:Uncharacterized protein n=1 Tax=Kistimonas scapharcae TaxID=1036133 RepID=A0ABP8V6X1_9GAMM